MAGAMAVRQHLAWVAIGAAVVAVAEIVVLVLVAHWLGVAVTVLLVLLTTLAGGWVLRREGVRAWRGLRAAGLAGRPPGREVGTGLVGLVAGLLLVLPGFLSDLVGLVLLVPPVRALTRAGVVRLAQGRLSAAAASDLFGPRRVRVRHSGPVPPDAAPGTGEVLEGEIVPPRPPGGPG